jgi:E3 ubiquitin-protein ligase RNF115/126
MQSTEKYWCHQCSGEIAPTTNNTCSVCGSEFIEEMEVDSAYPPAQPTPTFTNNTTTSTFQQPQYQRAAGFPPPLFAQPNPFGGPDIFSQMMQQVSAMLGQMNNPQSPMVFQTQIHTGPVLNFNTILPGLFGGFDAPGNSRFSMGDYVFGPNFEQLLNQLFENAGHHGPPPTAKSELDQLPSVTIEQSHIDNSEDCAVCKEPFVLNEEVKKLPCKHLYHEECIVPWLKMHNSCPVCRWELKTDDPDYERRKAHRRDNNNSTGRNSQRR